MLIRPARMNDLPALVTLLADDEIGQGREDLSPDALPVYRARLSEILGAEHITQFVVEEDGAIIGCLQLNLLPCLARRGMIRAGLEAVRVASHRRSQGIGEALVRHAVSEAKAKGAGLVELASGNARTASHRFYERLGFAKSHTGFKMDL